MHMHYVRFLLLADFFHVTIMLEGPQHAERGLNLAPDTSIVETVVACRIFEDGMAMFFKKLGLALEHLVVATCRSPAMEIMDC